jgi:hypothetical protein
MICEQNTKTSSKNKKKKLIAMQMAYWRAKTNINIYDFFSYY